MLRALHIENYALIDELHLQFDNGFTVITGETGTGKSILLGALSLILGNRADTSVLYNMGKKCVVEAEFDIKNLELQGFFSANELDYEEITIIRREILESGKSRAFVNDTPVTLNGLKELTEKLVDIHSQQNHLLLNKPDFRLEVLDEFSCIRPQLSKYKEVYHQYKETQKKLTEIKAHAARALVERDFLLFQANELREANLQLGEQEELEQKITFLKNAEFIKSQLFKASQQLSQNEQNCVQQLNEVKNLCSTVAQFETKIDALVTRISTILTELKDVSFDLAAKEELLEVNQQLLEISELRLDYLYRLQQKHHINNITELMEKQSQIEHKLFQFADLEEQITQLECEFESLIAKVSNLSTELSLKRQHFATELQTKIIDQLTALGMPDAIFDIKVKDSENYSSTGNDEVTFLFSANKGVSVKTMEKIASGGEMSRIMLAIKAIISASTFLPTVIFDEIDTGISGTMASKVAEVLHQISKQRQLLAITHIPQIAAKAKKHYVVYKIIENGKTFTKVKIVEKEERVAEVAQIISGNKTGEGAMKAAREMLELKIMN